MAGHTAAEAAELARPEPLLAYGVLRPGRLASLRRVTEESTRSLEKAKKRLYEILVAIDKKCTVTLPFSRLLRVLSLINVLSKFIPRFFIKGLARSRLVRCEVGSRRRRAAKTVGGILQWQVMLIGRYNGVGR